MKIYKSIEATWDWKAGCAPIWIGFEAGDWSFNVHLLSLKDIQWGYRDEWYDGPMRSFGLGPLALVCWCYK